MGEEAEELAMAALRRAGLVVGPPPDPGPIWLVVLRGRTRSALMLSEEDLCRHTILRWREEGIGFSLDLSVLARGLFGGRRPWVDGREVLPVVWAPTEPGRGPRSGAEQEVVDLVGRHLADLGVTEEEGLRVLRLRTLDRADRTARRARPGRRLRHRVGRQGPPRQQLALVEGRAARRPPLGRGRRGPVGPGRRR